MDFPLQICVFLGFMLVFAGVHVDTEHKNTSIFWGGSPGKIGNQIYNRLGLLKT